jgi:hypothetical protein
MANFLDDLSIYNAKAAAAISAAVVECNNEKANMMSSLKTTANDITLSEEIRLNALTALINLGNLLDIPLPPYFPSVTTYALTETFVGVHNDLDGLQGGAPGEYYHLTDAERTAILNKASIGDISWANLSGNYSDNATFGPLFDAKQDGLVAPTAATYFLKVSGNVVSYDNNVYLSSIEGIEAGGELEGTYRNPTLSNAAVIGKVLTGFDQFASIGTITASDTILSAIEKLNANIDSVIANPSGVASVAFSNNAGSVFTTTASPSTGAASLSLSLNTQTANLVLASPNATTGQPSFRALVAADLPNSGVTAATYGSSTVIPQIQVDAKGRITSVTAITAASGGQVNTITLAVPSFLSPSNINNALPASPQIVLQLATQTANTVFAGPATGAAAAPTFRLLVEDDIPQLPLTKITGLQDVLANKLDNELNDGEIWIGNSTNAPQMRSLTQDILITNTGLVTIQPNVVDFSKMQEITGTDTSVSPNIKGNLLGRWAAGLGEIQEVVLSGDFNLNVGTGVLSLAVPVAPVLTTKGGLITYSASVGGQVQLAAVYEGRLLMTDSGEDKGIKWVEAQGDIEVNTTLLDGTFNIKANAVTLGKIQQLPAFTVIGNATSTNPDTPTALSKTDLTTLVNQFTASASGAVPATGAAAGDSTKFLNAAGGWTTASGGGGTTTNALTIGSGLSGTAATFNGSAAVTISLNTGNANTWTALQTFTSASGIYLGEAGTSSGNLRFRGTTSGFVQFTSPAAPTNQSYILPTATGTTGQFLKLSDAGTGQLAWDTAGSGSGTVNNSAQYSIPYYSTAGSSNVLSGLAPQTTNGIYFLRANVTGGVAVAPNWDGSTGTGVVVLANTPTLITPVLGVASATSINKVAITAPATSATLTIADGKTFTSSNTLTLTGTDGASIAFGTGGTVAYIGVSNSWAAGVKQTFAPNATNAGVNVGSLAGDPSAGVNGDIVYNTSSNALRAFINGAWVSLGSGGGGGVTTFQTSLSGLTPSVATAGVVTLGGTLGVGSGGTGATTLTGLLRGTGTTAISGGATVALGSEVSGTLPVGNGGTNTNTTPGVGQLLIGNGTGYNVANLSSGGGITITNGAGTITLSATGSAPALNAITDATASQTRSHGNFAIDWQWNTLSSGTGLRISSTSTLAAGSTQKLFAVNSTGGNATAGVTTTAAEITNTHSGGTSTNIGLSLSASGGTTINYALDITGGIARIAAGTASAPQQIFTPSSLSGVLTGAINGSIWYDTNTTSGNSSLYLYKQFASASFVLTRFVTVERNQNFSGGATSGIIVSDSNGTLTKSADLTALGIYAQTNDVTVVNTATPTTIIGTTVGSSTLPANFFGVGKTIIIFVSGTYSQASGSNTCTLNFSIGGVAIGSIALQHGNSLATTYFEARIVATCRTVGVSGTVQYQGCGLLNLAGNPDFYYITSATSGSINTTTTNAINVTATWSAANPLNSLVAGIHTAQYIN